MNSRSTIPAALLLAASLAGPLPAETAYPKFSPLPQFAGAGLTAPSLLALDFASPLNVIETTDQMVRVSLADNRTTWLRRRDVFVSGNRLLVTAGSGFRVMDRPKLRFWRSHTDLSEFLSRRSAMTSNADYEEVLAQRPTFALRLPVYTVDETDVLGEDSVTVASVLLPISVTTPEQLAKVSGARQGSYDVQFLVDVSGDAMGFTEDTLAALALDLSRRLKDDGNDYRISVSKFGNDYRDGYSLPARTDWAALAEPLSAPPDSSKIAGEPVMRALPGVMPPERDGRTGGVLVILSGADLRPTAEVAALGGSVTLDTFKLAIPADVTVILAQITPEPAEGLQRLAKRLGVFGRTDLVAFSPGLGRTIADRIVAALEPSVERRLEDDELAQVCAAATSAGLLCALPLAATTAATLPQSPQAAVGLDWYSAVAWVVVEGLIVKLTTDNPAAGAITPP